MDRKVAIITGASSGIGRATALLFAKEGARVVVGARRKTELEALIGEIEDSGGDGNSIVSLFADEKGAIDSVACMTRNTDWRPGGSTKRAKGAYAMTSWRRGLQ